jgi:hypothetical protein
MAGHGAPYLQQEYMHNVSKSSNKTVSFRGAKADEAAVHALRVCGGFSRGGTKLAEQEPGPPFQRQAAEMAKGARRKAHGFGPLLELFANPAAWRLCVYRRVSPLRPKELLALSADPRFPRNPRQSESGISGGDHQGADAPRSPCTSLHRPQGPKTIARDE